MPPLDLLADIGRALLWLAGLAVFIVIAGIFLIVLQEIHKSAKAKKQRQLAALSPEPPHIISAEDEAFLAQFQARRLEHKRSEEAFLEKLRESRRTTRRLKRGF